MDDAAIIKEFDRPTPRKVCLTRDSPEAGWGFNKWGFFNELGCCGGPILGVFLLLAWAANFNLVASVPLIVFGVPVGWIAVSFAGHTLGESHYHKHLAQNGEAVIGRVTRWTSERTEDDTTAVTIEFQFHTRSGQELSGTRLTHEGRYRTLTQDGPVVVVYLPDEPKKNEPYNSLMYRVCE